MKINKKACRNFAAPKRAIFAGHGLLYAKQISYIIRAEVKVIDHHKVLVLYVYSCEEVRKGNLLPTWCVFQARDDFVTLEQAPLQKSRWRKAMFENLKRDCDFVSKCAFYSPADEGRVLRFLKASENGLCSLLRQQVCIQKMRRQERQRKREKVIAERMETVPPAPRDLRRWIERDILPAYFFYTYRKGKSAAEGLCSRCRNSGKVVNAKHNGQGRCPNCKHPVVFKSRGKRGYITDRRTCQVIQKIGSKELIVRIFKAYSSFGREETSKVSIYENARVFVKHIQGNRCEKEPYYFSYKDHSVTHWERGDRPTPYYWQYNFEADTIGYLYLSNVQSQLCGTPWQYCAVDLFAKGLGKPFQAIGFLTEYFRHPKVEQLTKCGFYKLASRLIYGYGTPIDETQTQLHRILCVPRAEIPYLREMNVDSTELRIYQGYCQKNVKDRRVLLTWSVKYGVEQGLDAFLIYMTPHKMMRYMEKQLEVLASRARAFQQTQRPNMFSALQIYEDYLRMCVQQHYDMKNSFVLFPADCAAAHDKVAEQIRMEADAKMRRRFVQRYDQIKGAFDFEKNGMRIVCPATPDDLAAEGNALHHCVGSYADRVAKNECVILFLRKTEELEKPFYTIEVQGRKVIQVRGYKNGEPTPEVAQFMKQWEKRVLQAPIQQAA